MDFLRDALPRLALEKIGFGRVITQTAESSFSLFLPLENNDFSTSTLICNICPCTRVLNRRDISNIQIKDFLLRYSVYEYLVYL